MMAPTDREMDQVLTRLGAIEDSLGKLREEMAVRRGVDAVLRWMAGGGGLVGLFGGIAILWHRLHGGGP